MCVFNSTGETLSLLKQILFLPVFLYIKQGSTHPMLYLFAVMNNTPQEIQIGRVI